MMQPILFVFGGLPGTGKTTLSRKLAERIRAPFLRIDIIEQALRAEKALNRGDEGYLMAYALAKDNLKLGNNVIADSVNPLPVTREVWQQVAEASKATLIEIEITCSNKTEHKRRLEERKADIEGFRLPTWKEVLERDYAFWETRSIVIDTAGETPIKSFKKLEDILKKLLEPRGRAQKG